MKDLLVIIFVHLYRSMISSNFSLNIVSCSISFCTETCLWDEEEEYSYPLCNLLYPEGHLGLVTEHVCRGRERAWWTPVSKQHSVVNCGQSKQNLEDYALLWDSEHRFVHLCLVGLWCFFCGILVGFSISIGIFFVFCFWNFSLLTIDEFIVIVFVVNRRRIVIYISCSREHGNKTYTQADHEASSCVSTRVRIWIINDINSWRQRRPLEPNNIQTCERWSEQTSIFSEFKQLNDMHYEDRSSRNDNNDKV